MIPGVALMHVLLVPFGSHGDVHPFLGLGLALRERGHRVTFLINEYFGPLVRGLGFAVEPLGEASIFEETMNDPDVWHPRKGFGAVIRLTFEHARLAFPRIEALNTPGETVIVGGTLALVTRLAHEKLGIPAASVHLQPAVMHSDHDSPVYGGFTMPRRWPRWLRRAFFQVVFDRVVEPEVAPALNALRREMGLEPVRDVMRRWLHAPELVLGFFPAWFGSIQPDWPPHVELVGFPLYDERDATPITPDLLAWLDAGPPPIAFTPGSANVQGRDFFEAATDACVRLGRRGLLLTRHPEQIPGSLPAGVRHAAYAPFGQLLPRAAALVHHGGIGTAAQGMAAGVPQLIMPLSHDQFDNAFRMRRLGIARDLAPAQFRGAAVAETLRGLLDAPEVAAACRAVAGRFDPEDRPMERASEAIERLNPLSTAPASGRRETAP